LKVMRLRRPQAEAPVPMLPLDASGSQLDAPKLLLPMSLTQSLVGEPFIGYLHLANHSATPAENVVVSVELEIGGSSKSVLFNNVTSPIARIEPWDFFDTDVAHELRDAGTYVLTCNVSYTTPRMLGETCSFKRSYRFPTLHPFAIVHRVAQLDTRLFVECQLENATAGSISLTSVRLDAKDGFQASLIRGGGNDDDSGESVSLLGSIAPLLKPRGVHNLIFIVAPRSDTIDAAYVRDLDLVGTLVLSWRVPDGASGCIPGHPIRVKPCSTPALDLRVVACPKQVQVEVPFELEVEVVNRTGREAEPSLVFDLRLMGNVKLHGATQLAVGRLEPYCAVRVPLHLLVAVPGMHALQGVSLLDDFTHARCEFGTLCDVLAF